MTGIAQLIPFDEWLPDLPQYMNPGALMAKNVIPQLTSYRSLNSLSSFSNALSGVCLGAFWARDDSNVVFNFAGDDADLYQLTGGDTWSAVSRTVGGAYSTATTWEFTKFGTRVIATSLENVLQYWDLGSSTAFENLPGSPPRGKHIATVRDFVMIGNTEINAGGTDATTGPNFIQWSGFNDSEDWTPSLATQADYQELFGRGGQVQRIVPGEVGVIFLEHSIFRADYIGPPVVFQIDEVEKKRGTPSPYSVIWTGDAIFYFGWDGFYHFDGRKSTPISHDRISRTLVKNAPADALDSMRGAVDRRNRLLLWAYRSSISEAINNKLIIYNWASDKWSEAEVDTQIIDEFVSPGFALDALDPLLADIDSESIPVDSDQYAGGALNVQAFNSSNEAATFDGLPLAATLDTKEVSGQDQERLYVDAIRPLVEAPSSATITVQVGTRNRLSENVSFTPARSLNGINGEANIRKNARYMRFRLNISGGFDHGKGVRANIREQGGRR